MGLLRKIHYNSPVVLSFALASLLVLVLSMITAGYTNYILFSTYRSSPFDFLTYIRAIGHVLGHVDFQHYTGNMMLLLLIGPPLEEKYGSKNMIIMFILTAIITSVVHTILFPMGLLGASGIVFMMIVLSSMTSRQEGRVPLTLIIIILMYLGEEIMAGISMNDSISQLTHIIGGVCGIVFGKIFKPIIKK